MTELHGLMRISGRHLVDCSPWVLAAFRQMIEADGLINNGVEGHFIIMTLVIMFGDVTIIF